ncbi:MAG: dipeptidase [Sulfobacillus sp.]
MPVSQELTYLEAHRERFLEDLLALVRIPSVSTMPERAADVRRAAELAAHYLDRASLEHVQVIATSGHPVVLGDWLHAAGAPTLLLYGHLDVQPADPESEWTSAPFAPEQRDGRLYGRGMADTKANVLSGIWACEAYLQTSGRLPVNVRFLLECEEEVGSPSLAAFVRDHSSRLAADAVVNLDAGQQSDDQPSLTSSYRGLIGFHLEVRTAAVDAHSGGLGGLIANPAMALAHILAGLQDTSGRVLVEGFYDQARPLTEAQAAQLGAMTPLAKRLADGVGAKGLWGDPEFSPIARNWLRPTLEVNGVGGGFQGAGSKTVIPATAFAKITCRLVADQDPEVVLDLVKRHIERSAPDHVQVSFSETSGQATPYRLPDGHPVAEAAGRVLERLYGRPPILVGGGGSVPATAILKAELGIDSIAFGFAQPDERIHAADEFFRLSDLERGRVALVMLLAEVGAKRTEPTQSAK